MGDDNNPSTLLGFDPATVAIRASGEGRLDEIKVCIVCSIDTAILFLMVLASSTSILIHNSHSPILLFDYWHDVKTFATSLMTYVDMFLARKRGTQQQQQHKQDQEHDQEHDHDEEQDYGQEQEQSKQNHGHQHRQQQPRQEHSVSNFSPSCGKRRQSTRTNNRPSKKARPSVPEPQIRIKPREGREGRLQDNFISHSVGHTRKVLDKNLETLGLHAQFGNKSISKYADGKRVSHITLNKEKDNLPYDESKTIEYCLNAGRYSLTLAEPLDPNENPQCDQGVPFFWAEKMAEETDKPSKCYYIGNYKCVSFERTPTFMHKGTKRQALLDFNFVFYDQHLADKLSNIQE